MQIARVCPSAITSTHIDRHHHSAPTPRPTAQQPGDEEDCPGPATIQCQQRKRTTHGNRIPASWQQDATRHGFVITRTTTLHFSNDVRAWSRGSRVKRRLCTEERTIPRAFDRPRTDRIVFFLPSLRERDWMVDGTHEGEDKGSHFNTLGRTGGRKWRTAAAVAPREEGRRRRRVLRWH